MKNRLVKRVGFVWFAVLTGVFACLPHALGKEQKPNVIFVLLDDLGKEWLGCYGAEGIETPRIDELAKGGIRFENAYSMPQCTPSRACFLTGQYPFRNGWVNHWDVPRWGLGYFDWRSNPSIGRMMMGAGYKTAAAGKWQLNDFREHPEAMVKHGFEEYCMWTGGETAPGSEEHTIASDLRYWDPYIHTKTGSKTYKGQFGPDIYNQFLLDFISENKDDPFFIYYPMALPHGPLTTTPHEPEVTEKYEMHKAMVRYIDYLTGKLMDHLDSLGIRERTLIVWTSDNGTSGSLRNTMNGREVRGGKTQTTENGVNTPFIVNWPGRVPPGQVSEALVDFSDMLPTFADLADATPESGYVYDGFNAADVFTGNARSSGRTWNLAMGSHPGVGTDLGIETAYYFRDRVIREERFKLFVGTDRQPEKLVDVIADPAEEKNLLGDPEYAPIAKRLLRAIEGMPEADGDPIYEQIPDYPIYRHDGKPSQIHKIGHPQNPNTEESSGASKKAKKK